MGHSFEQDRLPPAPDDTPRTGMFGTVATVDASQVTVAIDDFDQGAHYFGPVPATGATPVAGAQAFLHFDHRDQPAYAVIF